MKRAHWAMLPLFLAFASTGFAAQPTCTQFEVGFSPEGSAQELVLKVINSARRDVKIMAYSFTSRTVVQALVNARKRGVTISVVADSSNIGSRAGSSALSALATAGASIRTVDAYKITHDKVIIVDSMHVEFGSFNFSMAAAKDNSENANACFNSLEVASAYLKHWQSRWNQGFVFRPRY
jgi:phosphatidylserine/phosphatidylglycerophosphate/cardiolipin synthase-like enzyme